MIALSEFRTKPGAPICAALASRGWQFVESTKPDGSDSGLLVRFAFENRAELVRLRPSSNLAQVGLAGDY